MNGRARLIAALVLLGCIGCTSMEAQFKQHRQKFESLGSTTKSIGDAWLTGSVSDTYTRTALEQTLQLVEQERSTLASTPRALADSRGARMSQQAERLSRTIAQVADDVTRGNRESARQHLADVPFLPGDVK